MTLTWSIPWTRWYLVVDNSRSIRTRRFVHLYLSRNGTPWHHSRISILGGKWYSLWAGHTLEMCVCDECQKKARQQ